MNFDEMVVAWRRQEEQPLYGVNLDLLRLVVQGEQIDLERRLRLESRMTYLSGGVLMAGAFAALWWFLTHRSSGPGAFAAALSAGTFALWIAATWQSHRNKARRDRQFGGSVDQEIRRTLSAIDYQLTVSGRWANLTLWSTPVIVGVSLLYWLIAEINDNTPLFFDTAMIAFIVLSTLWTNLETSRRRRRQLLPQRRRLIELLDMLGAGNSAIDE